MGVKSRRGRHRGRRGRHEISREVSGMTGTSGKTSASDSGKNVFPDIPVVPEHSGDVIGDDRDVMRFSQEVSGTTGRREDIRQVIAINVFPQSPSSPNIATSGKTSASDSGKNVFHDVPVVPEHSGTSGKTSASDSGKNVFPDVPVVPDVFPDVPECLPRRPHPPRVQQAT